MISVSIHQVEEKKTVKVIPGNVSQKKTALNRSYFILDFSCRANVSLFLCISMSFCLRIKFVYISHLMSQVWFLTHCSSRYKEKGHHNDTETIKKTTIKWTTNRFVAAAVFVVVLFFFLQFSVLFAVRYNSLNYYWKLVSFRSLVGTIVGCYERYRMSDFNFFNVNSVYFFFLFLLLLFVF